MATGVQEAAVVQAEQAAAPPAKRSRRGLSAILRDQQLRRSLAPPPTQALVPVDEDSIADDNQDLDRIFTAEPLLIAGASDAADGADRCTSGAASGRRKLDGRAELREERPDDTSVTVTSSESTDMGNDLSVKIGLKLTTAQFSFRWFRRLPSVLLCQSRPATGSLEISQPVREAVLDICREYFPNLAEAPDMAVRWMDRIAACLSWYQLDGPPSRVALGPQTTPTAQHAAQRRVHEWDEAYRSLEVLLRQGSLPTFTIVSDKFSVSVFGKGAGSWDSARSAGGAAEPRQQQQPSSDMPCAVMCPSVDDIRKMLQENHVPFEVALCRADDGLRPSSEAIVPSAAGSTSLVPAATAELGAVGDDDHRMEMRELRRDGERVVVPEEMRGTVPLSEALWFEGAWRVHALLDVLRQHFLAAPLPASATFPSRLPRLIAPAPFSHATIKSAEVVKTQTLVDQAGQSQHSVDLDGFFFPRQVRLLLETLRVLLSRFSCRMLTDDRLQGGINAFTKFGMRHLDTVEVERFQASSDTAGRKLEFKWDFKLVT